VRQAPARRQNGANRAALRHVAPLVVGVAASSRCCRPRSWVESSLSAIKRQLAAAIDHSTISRLTTPHNKAPSERSRSGDHHPLRPTTQQL
jgi:hypothetical protein